MAGKAISSACLPGMRTVGLICQTVNGALAGEWKHAAGVER